MSEGRRPSGAIIFLYKRETESRNLISQLRVDSVDGASVFEEWSAERASLGLPVDFDNLPLNKTRMLANSGNRASEVERFLELGDMVNILLSVGGALRCLSSGLTSYANFCALLILPFVPTAEKSVLLWIATFATGRTSRNYAGTLGNGARS